MDVVGGEGGLHMCVSLAQVGCVCLRLWSWFWFAVTASMHAGYDDKDSWHLVGLVVSIRGHKRRSGSAVGNADGWLWLTLLFLNCGLPSQKQFSSGSKHCPTLVFTLLFILFFFYLFLSLYNIKAPNLVWTPNLQEVPHLVRCNKSETIALDHTSVTHACKFKHCF